MLGVFNIWIWFLTQSHYEKKDKMKAAALQRNEKTTVAARWDSLRKLQRSALFHILLINFIHFLCAL